jgi:hypothetical protein
MSVPPPGNPNPDPAPPVAPFCARCGAPNEARLAQCPHCGQSLVAAWPPPPGGYAPPQPYPPPQQTIGGLGAMIPDKNPSALTAYYLGIFSIIPCLAIPMGIAAVALGLRGLKLFKERPEVRGRTHAWVGIIAGGLFALLNIAGVIFVVAGMATQH